MGNGYYNRVLEKVSNKIIIDKSDFSTVQSFVYLICPIHGEYKKRVGSILYYNSRCQECGKIIKMENFKKTCLEKYGVEFPAQNKEVLKKMEASCMERHGVSNIFKIKEVHDSGIKAPQREDIKEKRKRTNIEKYGTENVFASEYCKEKIKKTLISKYGVTHYSQTEEFREKIVNTCLEKYGVRCYCSLPHVIEKAHTEEAGRKGYKTRIKNGNQSKIEDYLETRLIELGCQKGIDFTNQHKEERYPFHCDFYFPKKDLFVEINGHPTHGGHSFDKNSQEDIEKLEWLREKSKSSKYYANVIRVWTDLDIRKKEMAIKNNLNYFILWNKDDIDNFIKEVIMSG